MMSGKVRRAATLRAKEMRRERTATCKEHGRMMLGISIWAVDTDDDVSDLDLSSGSSAGEDAPGSPLSDSPYVPLPKA
jgi:hypothetical protein